MKKKAYIYVNYNNIVVLQSYLNVVKDALTNIGYECKFVKSLEGVKKTCLIVHPMGVDALKFYLKGFHNFILWQQGATANESYMRNHSKFRYLALNFIDVFAMKKARAIIYVSEYMKKHYERLGHCSFEKKSYLMPCFNEVYDDSIYKNKDYSKKTFTYVGSLDLWQCFEQTVELYKQIEDRVPNTIFKVLTFNVNEGKRILAKKGIKNYIIKCVPKEDVKKELLDTTFGFIIREDNIVNRVATPTKLSSYLSAGVIPIFSVCLNDFTLATGKMKYVKALPQDYCVDEIIDFINMPLSTKEIADEYKCLFYNYYSTEKHTMNLTTLFNSLLL